MKCPLIVSAIELKGGLYDSHVNDCLKEECEAWDKELKRCDPTGLIRPLIRLVEALEEIKDKMPHEEQFRK